MKKYIFIFSIISIVGCAQNGNQKINEKEKEELRIDTEILKSLNDSINSTGDFKYYDRYILKIDEMIKKYPDQKKELLKVKESMQEIYGE